MASSGLSIALTASPPSLSSPLASGADGAPANLTLSASERALFCSLSVPQLKRLAEDKRNASDDKKEELRQLVGVRYRVLIETADSILSMRGIVDDTQARLKQLHDTAANIGSTTTGSAEDGKSKQTRPTQLQLLLLLRTYALAPSSIWSSLDAHEFEAALLLLLRMRGVQAQLSAVEQWPQDSSATHPELQRLIEVALSSMGAKAGSNTPTAVSLASSLVAFFQQHAAYHAELPRLLAQHAFTRMSSQSSLSTQSYADCLTALALLLRAEPSSSSPLGVQLLDLFLESKRQQLHSLVSSAERALQSFRQQAGSARVPSPDPTPILVHACASLLLILQYTLLDVALLFASIHPARNPHAKLISSSAQLQSAWKQSHVAERVKAFWTKTAEGDTATAQAAAAAVSIEPDALAERVAAWLHSSQTFISQPLLHRLLPFLLPTSDRVGRRSGSSSSSCVSLQRLRDDILRTANWEDERSAAREGARAEDAAEERRAREQARVRESEEDERRLNQTDANGDAIALATPGARQAQLRVDKGKAQEQVPASEQSRHRRKRMLERWDEACTLLFGQRAPGAIVAPFSASSQPPISSYAAPLSLFDSFFLSPLCSFTSSLASHAFQRLTLGKQVDKFLLRPQEQESKAGEDESKEEKQATSIKPSRRHQAEAKEKDRTDAAAVDDDEFGLASLRSSSAAASAAAPSSTAMVAAPVTDLNGDREAQVQQLVRILRGQLRKLGTECRAILQCKYVQAHSSASGGQHAPSSSTAASSAPMLFPSLARFLHDELRPQLTRQFNQLVEALVEQLKKQLAQLEQTVLHSMSDVDHWRSPATLALVEQSVFIGRVCHELLQQKQLLSLESMLSEARGHKAVTNVSSSTSVHSSLSATERLSFRVWTRYLAAVLSEDFAQELSAWHGGQKELQRLGEKHVQLHTGQLCSNHNPAPGGGGAGEDLGLFLPVHASPAVFALLMRIHSHYYRLLGFRVHGDILSWLLTDIGLALLAVCENKVAGIESASHAAVAGIGGGGGTDASRAEKMLDHLSPQGVLQLFFDVQFLFSVLRLPSSSQGGGATAAASAGDARARYTTLLSAFEKTCTRVLDQIDWVASRSAFASNIRAALQRSAMLFGLLCKSNPFPPVPIPHSSAQKMLAPPPPPQTPGVGAGGVSVTNEAASSLSILPLAAPIPRIQPLSASLYPSRHPQPVAATPKIASAYTSYSSSSSALTAPSSTLGTSASSSSLTAPAPASSNFTSPSAAGGLSFSNLGAQLSLAQSSVHAKAIGDLGTSLLGKLSSSTLWGTSAKK